MVNEVRLAIPKQGVRVWNKWRQANLSAKIDLTEANLSKANLK